jgi:branched-chain amino acid transport system substrate-binding protein
MRKTAIVVIFAALVAACAPYTDLSMTPTQTIADSEDALRRGEYATAVSGFSEYLASGDTTFRARAFFELAQAQYGLENYEIALDTLNDLDDQYPKDKGPQVPALRGDIYYALGKRSEAIRQWDIAWSRGSDSDRQFLRSRIEQAIDELTPAEATELAGELQSDDVRAMLGSRVPGAVAANEYAETDAAARAAAVHSVHATTTAPPPPPPPSDETATAEEAAALGTLPPPNLDIAAGDATDASARVAALLPLTGPDRTYGQRALAGLRLAYTGFPRMLLVRDTGGQPELASQLVTTLADDPNVVAMIGPLRSSTAGAVAPLAERLQMPMLLLSRDQGLTGPYVMQVATSQQEQMHALADYAVHTLGLARFGVLYPDDPYGRGYLAAFSDEATRAGAALVKSSPYRPGQPSFSPQAATTKTWVSNDGIQAVFIPDAASTAIKVAEAARSAAPQLQLLGTESWNQPDVLATAGGRVDGAVFADSFFVGAGTPSTTDFVTRFRAQNGYDPSGFEAQAYDAGMLVREAIAKGARTRGGVLEFLRAVNGYQGASSIPSGATGLKPDLVLLQVQDGRVQTISR